MWELLGEVALERIEAHGELIALAGDVDPEALVRAQQLDPLADAERAQIEIQEVDVEALRGDVDRRVERVRVASKRARVAPGPVLALDHEHPAPGAREARARREPAEAGADHDDVEAIAARRAHQASARSRNFASFLGESAANVSASGSTWRTSPLSVRPEPSSRNEVTPAFTQRAHAVHPQHRARDLRDERLADTAGAVHHLRGRV